MSTMMCETIANIPAEEKSSYVLTEDMIDAAMNEQFAYQEDLISEEELSSPEESGDQDSQESLVNETETVHNTPPPPPDSHVDTNTNTTPSSNMVPTSSVVSNNKMSVLVIETGLDKNGRNYIQSVAESRKEDESAQTNTECGSDKTVDQNTGDSKVDVPILKTILSSNCKDSIIDLCDSEVDDFLEEDDATENEVIDDELKSVMETNLMAEIGMTVKKPAPEPENRLPRISVKNIAHISTHVFNSLSENGCTTSDSQSEQPKKTNENPINNNFSPKIPNYNQLRPLNDTQGTIQINKIAVPHSGFFNNQGQRMRCVYVKTTSSLPYLVNTPTQTIANSSDLRYVVTAASLGQKPSMPAIATFQNSNKSANSQTLMLPKNAKLVTVAKKVQKPMMPPTNPKVIQKIKNNVIPFVTDMLKKTLFDNPMKTYTAPDTFPEHPTYTCIDCNDKFLLKTSLSNHVERRSISIGYWCQICKASFQFFNKCSLSIHLRSHNMSMKQIDMSSVQITPIAKEMVEKGIVTAFFKDGDLNSNKSMIYDKPQPAVNLNVANSILKPVPGVSGQSKIVNQGLSLNEKIKALTSQNKQCSGRTITPILPKPANPVKSVSLVNKSQVQNQTKESSASNMKSLILFCNKLNQPQNVMGKSAVNIVPPNVVCDVDTILNNSSAAVETNDSEIVNDDNAVPNQQEEEELVDVDDSSVSSSIPTPVLNSRNKENGKRIKCILPSNSSKRTCSECLIYCANITKHLSGTGRPVRLDLACNVCQLILPSKCALKIHTRIHMKTPPYKCPDCGKDFTTWDELYAHLKFSCGHFAKCIRFICLGCKAHFPTGAGLTEHIVTHHGKDIFKCSLCPVAFYKRNSLLKHIFHDHPNEPDPADVGLDYKQCDMCPKKLLPEESYIDHAKEHSNSMIYGYKCSMCNIVYANKMAFIIHQIKEKAKKDKMEKSITDKANPPEEDMQVSDSDTDLVEEPVIIRRYPETESVDEKDPLSLDDWECTQEQKVKEKTTELCIVCKKNSVVLLPGIDLNNQSLCCKQCVKPIDDNSSTESFSSRRNSKSRPKSRKLSTYRSSSSDDVKSFTAKRRTSITSPDSSVNELSQDPLADSPPKKKSRKKPKDKRSVQGQTHIQGQVIKSRSLNELCHKCSKCEFVSEDRESFLVHITIHRTDPNTYQCLECGLCFVVLPSLETHLQMHHGIKDVNSYTQNNTASLPQKASSSIEEETLENQCPVCFEVFGSKLSHDKHFRIHGMAFMSRLSKSP
ncbi:zinc finger protein 532-like [Macrosteles quadrilineatus]|uniref:zinc finger protein 532-like n=1 Tax=Macrosteles quadrilineatus TaxID=74068 RepID=UPI0023E13855|nr:zinc finger protein 532-like [Macrosteles quadrilineatus]